MKTEIITLKYNAKEIIRALSFYLLFVIVFLLIFYFGLNFDLENIITSTFTALIMIIFVLTFNKNAVLRISECSDPASIKDAAFKVLAKKGFVKAEESSDRIKFHYRTKMNRFFASFFFDHVIIKTSENDLLIFGKRTFLFLLKCGLNRR